MNIVDAEKSPGYNFLDTNSQYNTSNIEILDGVFKGVVFAFYYISIKETEPILSFKFDIVEVPDRFSKEDLETNMIFLDTIASILVNIIVTNAKVGDVDDGENRDDDI